MSYVSRLRSALGEDIVELVGPGYCFRPGSVSLDSVTFRELVEEGRRLQRVGNAAEALHSFEEAMTLWRGEPAEKFAGEHWIEPERVRLNELRLLVTESMFEVKLDLNDHADVLADLELASIKYPERERLAFLHMLALYRSSRQVEALHRYKVLDSKLAELGLSPSKAVKDLEVQILTQDITLRDSGPEPGTSIRGYRLGERIGEGSTGTIYQAVQSAVGRDVAIKVIRPEFADLPQFIRRFETEAQLIANLEHPHVVPLYDYWREPGGAYLVMRLLRGGNAADRLAVEGQLTLPEVALIVEQIGQALTAAHSRGIVHRRVRPTNILFDDDGIAYLAGFSIADPEVLNSPGWADGPAANPEFSSPEQIQGKEATSRSDIFSLGITICALLAAWPDSGLTDRAQRGHDRGSPWAVVNSVLCRAIALDPKDRFPDTAEFVRAFRLATADVIAREHPTRERGSALEETSVNPYKGLRAFQESDGQDFFGRGRLVSLLNKRITTNRFVAVVGASGSGKSSVVRAGLVPSIADQNWFVVNMKPGTHPLQELEVGLTRVALTHVPGLLEMIRRSDRGLIEAARSVLPADASELLLVIDQFEEVFNASDLERDQFLDALLGAVVDEGSRVRVVITIRADFYDRPLRHRAFGAILQDNIVNVVPMTRWDLAEAIEGPARRVGTQFEEGLVSTIADDVGGRAGMLPLLQYAMTELFERCRGRTITLADYQDIGGVTGVLGRRAEALYASIRQEDQPQVRKLFTRLVTLGEGVEDTRRRALRAELGAIGEDVTDMYGHHRLLSFDRDPITRGATVEVAHEALIREWPRLRQWLDDDRSGLRILRHLTAATQAWISNDREPGELYRGSRLESAVEWAGSHHEDLTGDEAEFLSASSAVLEAERHEAAERIDFRERQNTRLRRTIRGVVLLAVLLALAGGVALQQWVSAGARADEATQAQYAAETRRLISDVGPLADSNRRVALLLAVEANNRQPGSASLGALQAVLVRTQGFVGYVASDLELVDIDFTVDGQLVGIDSSGVVLVEQDREARMTIPLPSPRTIEIRSDSIAAVALAQASIQVVDLKTGQVMGGLLHHDARVQAMAFSDDGSRFVSGDGDGMIRLFDEQFELIAEFEAHPPSDRLLDGALLPEGVAAPLPHQPETYRFGVSGVALSSDGRTLASTGGFLVRVWDTDSLQLLSEHPVTRATDNQGEILAEPTGVGFVSREGAELVAVANLWNVELWSAISGESVDRWGFAGGGMSVPRIFTNTRVAFGDHLVATVSNDGRIRTASGDGSKAVQFDTQLGSGIAIEVDHDGNRLAVAGKDGAVLVSTVGAGLISASVGAHGHHEFYVSNDGSVLVGVTVNDRPVELWRRRGDAFFTFEPDTTVETYGGVGVPGAFGYDTKTLYLQEREPASFEPFGPAYGPHSAFQSDVSSDGTWIAIGLSQPTDEPATLVYDRKSGDLVARLASGLTDETDVIRSLDFSPDNTRLVVASDEGEATVYETTNWLPLEPALSGGGGAVVQAKYTPDGRFLVTASLDGAITVRDAQTFQPDGHLLLGNKNADEGSSWGPVFSPDSRWMVTTMDGDTRLWDLSERVMIGSPFPRDGEETIGASNNARYATTVLDGRVVVWNLDVLGWSAIACQAAGRNLTLEEWHQFGPDGELYQVTCPQWPSGKNADTDPDTTTNTNGG